MRFRNDLTYSNSMNDSGESRRLGVKPLTADFDAQERWQMRSASQRAPGLLIPDIDDFSRIC